ncbi:hypothetical protein D5086_005414 [Populus alba]|uniref:Uncharacterized protein n=1 Tax=Populus alba TaxID=43335 RepID=A0ACC4CT66_POPAL
MGKTTYGEGQSLLGESVSIRILSFNKAHGTRSGCAHVSLWLLAAGRPLMSSKLVVVGELVKEAPLEMERVGVGPVDNGDVGDAVPVTEASVAEGSAVDWGALF